MTNLQIEWQNYLEAARANRAREEEIRRHNVFLESEGQRHSLVEEQETVRHNVETEREARFRTSVTGAGVLMDYKAKMKALAETQRRNRAQEFLTKAEATMRYSLAKDKLAIDYARHNLDVRRLELERRWKADELAMRDRLKRLELSNALAIAERQLRARERIESRNIAQRQQELGLRKDDIRFRVADNAAARESSMKQTKLKLFNERINTNIQRSSAESISRERNKFTFGTALVGLAGTLSQSLIKLII